MGQYLKDLGLTVEFIIRVCIDVIGRAISAYFYIWLYVQPSYGEAHSMSSLQSTSMQLASTFIMQRAIAMTANVAVQKRNATCRIIASVEFDMLVYKSPIKYWLFCQSRW